MGNPDIANESTPNAHATIASALPGTVPIDPFVFGRRGMERSFEAFAIKLRSIRRDYRVLCGADPFDALEIPTDIVKFLCEQSIRNLRLRTVHTRILFADNRTRYQQFLLHVTPSIFIALSEAVRLAGTDVPHDLADRIPILEEEFGAHGSILSTLLELRERPHRFGLGADQAVGLHTHLFGLLDQAARWIEERWPRGAFPISRSSV